MSLLFFTHNYRCSLNTRGTTQQGVMYSGRVNVGVSLQNTTKRRASYFAPSLNKSHITIAFCLGLLEYCHIFTPLFFNTSFYSTLLFKSVRGKYVWGRDVFYEQSTS